MKLCVCVLVLASLAFAAAAATDEVDAAYFSASLAQVLEDVNEAAVNFTDYLRQHGTNVQRSWFVVVPSPNVRLGLVFNVTCDLETSGENYYIRLSPFAQSPKYVALSGGQMPRMELHCLVVEPCSGEEFRNLWCLNRLQEQLVVSANYFNTKLVKSIRSFLKNNNVDQVDDDSTTESVLELHFDDIFQDFDPFQDRAKGGNNNHDEPLALSLVASKSQVVEEEVEDVWMIDTHWVVGFTFLAVFLLCISLLVQIRRCWMKRRPSRLEHAGLPMN